MITLNKEIIKGLKNIGIPVYFINKKDAKAKEYIIFSYTENPVKFADNQEDLTNIIVYMNLYMKDNFLAMKKKIEMIMKELGYIRKTVPNAYYEEKLELYNQALQFTKNIESGELYE